MKTITEAQYLYLKAKKNAITLKNRTKEISDEEYEDLIQYSDKIITPINNNDNPGTEEPENPEPEEPQDEHDYSQDYLTFEALEDGCQFSINNDNFQYSLDDGKTWIMLNKNELTPSINAGQKIIWKQYGLYLNDSSIGTYKSNFKQFNVFGNIMSILYGDNFINKNELLNFKQHIFDSLFAGSYIINAKNLILSALILSNFCYYWMFYGCSKLITAPKLPATTLASNCYEGMFSGCSSLIEAPELPATTLADSCYSGMFTQCSSLITAPKLLAITLSQGCYQFMFSHCTSLTTAPELPATELVYRCYEGMFYNCINLKNAPELLATPPIGTNDNHNFAYRCYLRMFENCESLIYIKCLSRTYDSNNFVNWTNNVGPKYITDQGIFIKLKDTEFLIGSWGIPSGWLVKELDPETMEVVNEYIAE